MKSSVLIEPKIPDVVPDIEEVEIPWLNPHDPDDPAQQWGQEWNLDEPEPMLPWEKPDWPFIDAPKMIEIPDELVTVEDDLEYEPYPVASSSYLNADPVFQSFDDDNEVLKDLRMDTDPVPFIFKPFNFPPPPPPPPAFALEIPKPSPQMTLDPLPKMLPPPPQRISLSLPAPPQRINLALPAPPPVLALPWIGEEPKSSPPVLVEPMKALPWIEEQQIALPPVIEAPAPSIDFFRKKVEIFMPSLVEPARPRGMLALPWKSEMMEDIERIKTIRPADPIEDIDLDSNAMEDDDPIVPSTKRWSPLVPVVKEPRPRPAPGTFGPPKLGATADILHPIISIKSLRKEAQRERRRRTMEKLFSMAPPTPSNQPASFEPIASSSNAMELVKKSDTFGSNLQDLMQSDLKTQWDPIRYLFNTKKWQWNEQKILTWDPIEGPDRSARILLDQLAKNAAELKFIEQSTLSGRAGDARKMDIVSGFQRKGFVLPTGYDSS